MVTPLLLLLTLDLLVLRVVELEEEDADDNFLDDLGADLSLMFGVLLRRRTCLVSDLLSADPEVDEDDKHNEEDADPPCTFRWRSRSYFRVNCAVRRKGKIASEKR